MSNFVTKTPVSCLQEYSVAKKMTARYNTSRSGGTSHNPEFTCRVEVGALWEESTGRSIQDAKHRAAEKMLKALKLYDSKEDFKPENSEEMSEFNQESTENYVGQLKDLCKNIHYPDPEYRLGEESGPSHNRVFKMICCVSQLQEFGIAKTKKKAKQQAASKMLQRLKEVGGKKIEDCLNNIETQNKIASPSMSDQEILDKYNALKSKNLTVTKDPAAFYKDNHMAYIVLKETSPTLNKILNTSNIANNEESLAVIQDIAKELGAELSTVEIPRKKEQYKYTIMIMHVTPPIGAVGEDKKQAAFSLLKSLLLLSQE